MKTLYVLMLGLLLLAACRKEEEGDPLLRYRLTEYTRDHYRFTYAYDAQDRLHTSGTWYDDGLLYNTYYFYENGRLDSMISYSPAYLNDFVTFRYSGDTLVQTTVRPSMMDTTVIRFLRQEQRVVKVIQPDCVLGDSSFPCCYKVLHWDADNLTYKYFYSNSGWAYPLYKQGNDGFEMTNAVWSEYDQHPNPLKPIYALAYPEEYESSANNLLRMVVADQVGDTLFRIFEHTYNENGLPATTTEHQEKNDTPLNSIVELHTYFSTYTYEKYR
jgi:hypothetical protein